MYVTIDQEVKIKLKDIKYKRNLKLYKKVMIVMIAKY